jgi:hypothetical protein
MIFLFFTQRRPTRRPISLPHSRWMTAILTLQVEPELRAVAEIAAPPHRRIGRNRPAAVQNIGDAAGWDAEVESEPVGAEVTRRHLPSQEPARMCDEPDYPL